MISKGLASEAQWGPWQLKNDFVAESSEFTVCGG